MRRICAVVLILSLSSVALARDPDDGQPFGRTSEEDFEAFTRFAASHGLEVETEMKKVYEGDSDAFVRVFQFAMQFRRLDSHARAYGNMLYATFLNIMESKGDAVFVAALEKCPAEVRQRARDFLYYPVTQAPRKERAEMQRDARGRFSKMFPSDYEFGKNDALFD